MFTNYPISIEERQVYDQRINGAVIGHCEQGGKYFYLSAPRKAGRTIKGNRPDLSIIDDYHQDSGIWRVIKGAKHQRGLHLLLSSRPDDYRTKQYKIRPSIGRILAPTAQALRLLDFSESSMPNGARWNEVLLKAQPGDIFAVDICGHQSYRRYYLVDRREVIEVKSIAVNEAYRGLLGLLDLPYDCEQGTILDRLWRNVLDPLGS